jgi:hypothetical protein
MLEIMLDSVKANGNEVNIEEEKAWKMTGRRTSEALLLMHDSGGRMDDAMGNRRGRTREDGRGARGENLK